MLYLTCTTITSVDLAHYGVSRSKDWVSVDCGTSSYRKQTTHVSIETKMTVNESIETKMTGYEPINTQMTYSTIFNVKSNN